MKTGDKECLLDVLMRINPEIAGFETRLILSMEAIEEEGDLADIAEIASRAAQMGADRDAVFRGIRIQRLVIDRNRRLLQKMSVRGGRGGDR